MSTSTQKQFLYYGSRKCILKTTRRYKRAHTRMAEIITINDTQCRCGCCTRITYSEDQRATRYNHFGEKKSLAVSTHISHVPALLCINSTKLNVFFQQK